MRTVGPNVFLIVSLCLIGWGVAGLTGEAETAGEKAEQKQIHKECTACHTDKEYKDYATSKAVVSQACLKCHPGSENRDHPIGVKPQRAEGLPLDEDSRITCVTCHEPHGKETVVQLLRKDFNSLCRSCHKT